MANNATLTHPLVNGGTPVNMYNSKVSYAMKKLQKVAPIPGKFDLAEVEYGGLENPKLTVTFVVDVNDVDSNEMNQELLTEFLMVQSTTPLDLSLPTGATATPTYLKGRPSEGYDTDGSMDMQDSIKVSIDSFDISFDSSSDQGHFWTYKLVLTETV